MTDGNQIATMEALLAGAATQANHLAEISEELLKQVKLSRVARIYFIVMTALILAVCSVLTWIAVGNRAINSAVQDNTNRIIDCTTAGGSCYQNGQKSQATAVAAIVNAQLASAWCARHTKTFDAAQKCVVELTKPH